MGLNVLVTGGTGGIGSAIVRAMRLRNDLVVATGHEHDVRSVYKWMPDLVRDRLGGQIDVLVQCAGSLRDAMSVNFIAAADCMSAALMFGAKCIILFSGGGVGGPPPPGIDPYYCASKAALVVYAEHAASLYKDVAIHVVAPGKVATRFTDFQGGPPDKAVELVLWLTESKRMRLSGCLLAARDNMKDLEKPTSSDAWKLRRVSS